MTTPYEVSEEGTTAVVPRRGPCFRGTAPCAIGVHHRRQRKTGPPWGWVAVVRCSTHARAFTVYPAGHVPFGREPFVVLAPDGSEVTRDERGEIGGLMAAAVDARDGDRWPREEAAGAVRTTQRRRVHAGARLLGLAACGETTPTLAAGVLHFSEGKLVETARELLRSRDLAAWGRQVSTLLAALARRGGRWLMDRLAVLGHLAGWWGRPWRWLPRARRLLALGRPFWARPGARTRGRAPP